MANPAIYSTHAYGDSMYYAHEDRENLIAELADLYGETVEEFRPGFMDNENEIDLIEAFNADEGPEGQRTSDCWQNLIDHTDIMTPDAREIFNAFFASVKPLADVMTVAEIAEEFSLDVSGIRATIQRGQIPARKSGATWLVLRTNAQDRWGSNPEREFGIAHISADTDQAAEVLANQEAARMMGEAAQTAQATKCPDRCEICGKPGNWNPGAAQLLCWRHWDEY